MIEVLVFDVGGTYVNGHISDFIKKVEKLPGVPKIKREKNEIIFDPQLNSGRISVETALEKFFKQKLPAATMKKLVKLWTSNWIRQPEMKELVDRLGKVFRLAILSNSDPANSPVFKKKGYYKPFDVVVLSHEEHVMKPDKKIYRILLKKLKTTADKCLFIDDVQTNLDVAKKLGMKVILFKNIKQFQQDLEKIILDRNFKFLKPGKLVDRDLELVLEKTIPANLKKGYLPAYEFNMINSKTRKTMGVITLRIGLNEKIHYGGHIGYGVDEKYRGHHYAARSCKLLYKLAKRHGVNPVIITCNPENIASARSAELSGAKLIETVRLPKHNDMYQRGDRKKKRFEYRHK